MQKSIVAIILCYWFMPFLLCTDYFIWQTHLCDVNMVPQLLQKRPSSYLKLISYSEVCAWVCVCVQVMHTLVRLGALWLQWSWRGQARALIGRQILCNLCQITAITRLLLLFALMTPLQEERGSSSNPHTSLGTHTLSDSHTARSGLADRAGHHRALNRERRSTSRWEEINTNWSTCTHENVYTFT